MSKDRRNKCQKCGVLDPDVRTLWMACFYAMEELGIPFEQVQYAGEIRKQSGVKDGPFPNSKIPVFKKDGEVDQHNFYRLVVCKDCRADWMNAIKGWFNDLKMITEGCGSGIFVRENGRNIEITREEWDRRNPGREPVVFKA